MSKYNVELTWPRASKQSNYFETVDAVTRGEALLKVTGNAKREGWKGEPIKSTVTIAREVE